MIVEDPGLPSPGLRMIPLRAWTVSQLPFPILSVLKVDFLLSKGFPPVVIYSHTIPQCETLPFSFYISTDWKGLETGYIPPLWLCLALAKADWGDLVA